MTPTELIRVIGPIVFGPRWQTDVAVTVGINARSVDGPPAPTFLEPGFGGTWSG